MPLSPASNQPDCGIPQERFLTSGLCTCVSPSPAVLSPVLQVATYISPPPKSWQYWHKPDCPFWVFLVLSFTSVLVFMTLHGNCPFVYFSSFHFSGWTGSPSSYNSSACHMHTSADSYWVNEWRMRKTETLILSHTCDHEQIIKLLSCVLCRAIYRYISFFGTLERSQVLGGFFCFVFFTNT